MSAHPIPPLRHREPPREPLQFPRRRPRWQKVVGWTLAGIGILIVVLVVAVVILLHSTGFQNWALRKAEPKISAALGAQVNAQKLTISWSGISPTADLYNVVVHGAPPYTDPPLLTADHLHLAVKVTSLLKRTWYIDDLAIEHPVVRAFVDRQGRNNFPQSKSNNSQSKTDVFDLGVRHATLNNGEVYYNDRKTPLEADLHDLTFRAGFDPAQTRYSGTLSYDNGHLLFGTYRPIPHALNANWSYTRSAFNLDRAVLTSGKSQLTMQASLEDFSAPKLQARYDASLDTNEFRALLRNPSLPAGMLHTAGDLRYVSDPNRPLLDTVTLSGDLNSRALQVETTSLRTVIRDLGAHYSVANGNAEVRDLRAALLGGELTGLLTIRDLAGDSRSNLHVALRNISLAALKAQAPSPAARQADLRGALDATADAAWGKTMADLIARADASLHGGLGPNIPLDGVVHARYSAPTKLTLAQSYVRTRQTALNLNGTVSDRSALQVQLHSNDLRELETIKDTLSPRPPDQAPLGLAGSASFNGAVRGSTAAPQIAGRFDAANLKLRGTAWRTVHADLQASPSLVRIENGTLDPATRGHIAFALQSALQKWAPTPQTPFDLKLDADNINVADLLRAADQTMPVTGTLGAHIAAHGTRTDPIGQGTVALTQAKVASEPIQSLNANFNGTGDVVRAHLTARITAGNADAELTYRPKQQTFETALRALGIRLDQLQTLKARNLDLAGVLNLTANGSGSVQNPNLQASLNIPQLTMHGQRLSNLSFQGNVANHVAQFVLDSQLLDTAIQGRGRVGLTGNYDSDITLDTHSIAIAPLVAMFVPSQAGNITGRTELHAAVRGPLKNKSQLDAHLVIPVLQLAYKNAIQLGATGPIRADFTNGVIQLQPMEIKGTGTDLRAQGRLPLNSTAPSSLLLLGTVDLKLAQLVSPDIASSGQLRFNIDSTGPRANPDVQGRIDIVNANFASGDVPIGLQNGNGVLTLTRDHLNVTEFKALMGGGPVTASGGIRYRPSLDFSLGLQGQDIRLLYQDAIRAGFNTRLSLSGNLQAATLNGNVDITQLQFTPDFDLMNFVGSLGGGEATPPPTEGFSNNLKLDIGVSSGGGVHLVSRTMSVEGAANLRVNGTASQPVILGRVNLDGGDLIFMGNRYKLQGGTIDFVDPSRTNPTVNVAVNTTVQQYDIQMRFWGPADHLHTTYTSDPALPPSDIINLIAFGKTTEASEANPTPPGSLGAESLVASQVSSQVTNRIEKFAGISQLSIDPVLGGNQQNPGAHVAIQQRVTSKIFVTFSSDVTSTQNQVIKFEYQLNPRVSISATRDQNGGFAIDTRIHKKW